MQAIFKQKRSKPRIALGLGLPWVCRRELLFFFFLVVLMVDYRLLLLVVVSGVCSAAVVGMC